MYNKHYNMLHLHHKNADVQVLSVTNNQRKC